MTFYPIKLATKQRCAAQIKAAQEKASAYQIHRLLQKYHGEPDREYAEALWGSILRERGVNPKDLG